MKTLLYNLETLTDDQLLEIIPSYCKHNTKLDREEKDILHNARITLKLRKIKV